MTVVWILYRLLWACCVGRATLMAENLALRHQLAVLRRARPWVRLRWWDRLFWVWLSRWFAAWWSWLTIVQPQTVLRWHRLGFRRYWRWKSSGGVSGRPTIPRDVITLIRRMARDNPLWGAPRIRAELHWLGHDVAESTVAKYMPRERKPPSQTWKTFLANHVGCLASIDFFVVPTITFKLLYGFVVLCHERRRVLHVNVTAHPTAAWVAQQLREAFPYEHPVRYLIRDRDSIYGQEVQRCLRSLGIKEVIIAPRSPWQNPFVERLIGTLRRELLNHVIVFSERHLLRLLHAFRTYYHRFRGHQSLGGDAPHPRAVDPPNRGQVVADPMVGGLHHRYRRCA
jgi:transposase InsO family protein